MAVSTIKLFGFVKRILAEMKVSINTNTCPVEEILTRNLPFYSVLDNDQKKIFIRKVLVFLNSKNFIGVGDFKNDLTHNTIISALAVRLVFKLGLKYYDHILRIYLFETEFLSSDTIKVEGITQSNGTIGLAWNAIEEGITNQTDGKNVAYHEFAHALDLFDKNFDGIPVIFRSSVIKPLVSGLIRNHEKFLNEWKEWHRFTHKYETKDIAEFFAKITELYFENPIILKSNDQELFNILFTIYRYEPIPIRVYCN